MLRRLLESVHPNCRVETLEKKVYSSSLSIKLTSNKEKSQRYGLALALSSGLTSSSFFFGVYKALEYVTPSSLENDFLNYGLIGTFSSLVFLTVASILGYTNFSSSQETIIDTSEKKIIQIYRNKPTNEEKIVSETDYQQIKDVKIGTNPLKKSLNLGDLIIDVETEKGTERFVVFNQENPQLKSRMIKKRKGYK